MSDIEVFLGNRSPSLFETITSGDLPVDLTGSTVKLKMRPANSSALKINTAATVLSPAAGTIRYDWATGDVDTVGDFLGWFEVTKAGKTQDTREFTVSVIEHAPSPIAVLQPVASDGRTTIYQGDAYPAMFNRELRYELRLMGQPNLENVVGGTWRVEGEMEKAMTVVDEDTIYVELTTTETLLLSPGDYTFEVEVTLSSGQFATLLRIENGLTVLRNLV